MTPFSVSNYLASHYKLAQQLDATGFSKGIELVECAFREGRKIITCGNGGSATTASHYITDWNKAITQATGKKFKGICLSDNSGLITAYGNDIGFKDIFAGQIHALMDEGDLLVAISGSGNSPNILKAIEAARSVGGIVLGVVGYDGGKMTPLCDRVVWVPSFDMQLCEDVHLMFGHMVMKSLCGFEIK